MSHQIAVIAQIRPGKRAELERTLDQGPPFSLAEHGLTRHVAFLGDTDVVLVFEGDQPFGDVRRLAASLGLGHLTKMATLIARSVAETDWSDPGAEFVAAFDRAMQTSL